MPKIDINMNSVYETGKIRGYATALIDDNLSIRGIKIEQNGDDPFEVAISMPERAGASIFSLFPSEFSEQLRTSVAYAYYSEIGVDMTVADPIENTSCDTRTLDVLMTKMYPDEEKGNLMALANVNIDDSFSVNRVEVREVAGDLEVQMPQRKTVDGYKEICSLPNETYETLFKEAVLEGYSQRLEQIQTQGERFSVDETEMDEQDLDSMEEVPFEVELDEQQENSTMGGIE